MALIATLLFASSTAMVPADFAEAVVAYRQFTAPVCAPELVETYKSYYVLRDSAYLRSLGGTPLYVAWYDAVRAEDARRESIVFHCDEPPPPPGTPEAALPPRDRAIARAQRRLRGAADNLPAFFAAGDAAFARLTALRDAALASMVR